MKTFTRRIDYTAAHERLQAATDDLVALASFDRVAESGEVNDEFLGATLRLNISLDRPLPISGVNVAKALGSQQGGELRLVPESDILKFFVGMDSFFMGS